MKRYRILMTEPAAEDLLKIAEYIARELREPATAQKLVGKIKEAVMSLVEMPTRYATVAGERLATQGIRKLPLENYIDRKIYLMRAQPLSYKWGFYNKLVWQEHPEANFVLPLQAASGDTEALLTGTVRSRSGTGQVS